jgi:hypothetical protein
VNSDSAFRSVKPNGLWLWAAAGLVGPALTWGAVLLGLPERKLPLSELVAFLYPTWLFCWLVMGVKSNILGNAIFALTVVGNVSVFTAVGFVCRRLRRRSVAMQWGSTAVVYASAYAAVTFVAYCLL